MYVVFTDPYYKEIRFFEGINQSEEPLNGHYIDFNGNLDFLIAELMLIGMISLAGNGTYMVNTHREFADPNEVLNRICGVPYSCHRGGFNEYENIYERGQIYNPIEHPWRYRLNYRERADGQDAVLLGKLIQVVETYGDAVADLEIAISGSQYGALFTEHQIDTSVLDDNGIWTSVTPFDNGTLNLMIEGIGSGKLFTWPTQLKSCSEIRCQCGNVRHKLDNANHLYRQVELLIYKLQYRFRNLNIPTIVEFNVNASDGESNIYRNGWQRHRDYDHGRNLPIHYKTLKLWSEFKPKTPE